MRFQNAIVRLPADNFAEGITRAILGAPSFALAYEQHARYGEALRANGLIVTTLEPNSEHPDAQFVEDTAVLVDRRAVLARPGAPSRIGEVAAIREELAAFFDALDEIVAPGTLDGGDICEAGDHYYIGLSHRTNRDGAEQLAALLAKAGKTSMIVDIRDVPGILHLKSGMSYLGDERFAVIEELVSRIDVPADRIVRVQPEEAYGANCVRVNDVVLIAAGNPRLASDLARAGYATTALDMSEYRKMDGGLSCLSLRF